VLLLLYGERERKREREREREEKEKKRGEKREKITAIIYREVSKIFPYLVEGKKSIKIHFFENQKR
jgi:hypothetical protein